jgi:hypothetical protein
MFSINNNTYYITATRFNDITWQENEDFRIKNNLKGCIYGVSKEIPISIKHKSILLVFEMNNTKPSRIMGLGIVKNYLKVKKKYNIYSDNNYNRYFYCSKYRLTRDDLRTNYEDVLLLMEELLFKGKDHIKRGEGISKIPEKKSKPHLKVLNEFTKDIIKNYIDKK